MTITEEPPVIVGFLNERRQQRGWHESPRRIVLIFAALFIFAEAIGAFVNIPLQAAADAICAFVALNFVIFGFRTQRTAGLVMAALFADRVAVLMLPTAGISVTTRMGLIGGLTIAVAGIATSVLRIDVIGGRAREGLTLRKPIVSPSFTSALTVLSGFPIGWAAYETLKPAKLIILNPPVGGQLIPWIAILATITLGAFGEELLYRRLVAAMVQHTGQSQTPWVSALIYGAAFLDTHNLGMITAMGAAGLIFAWSCERTGSVKPVIAAHIIANILFFVVLPH